MKEQFVKCSTPTGPCSRRSSPRSRTSGRRSKNLAVAALEGPGRPLAADADALAAERPGGAAGHHGAIRAYMMQGPEASGRVRAALDEEFGERPRRHGPAHAHRLHARGGGQGRPLHPPGRPARRPSRNRGGRAVGIRELALDTLRRLTGRDDLGYDPDKPAGKGFDAWNDLLRRNELRTAPTPPATGRPPRTKGQR